MPPKLDVDDQTGATKNQSQGTKRSRRSPGKDRGQKSPPPLRLQVVPPPLHEDYNDMSEGNSKKAKLTCASIEVIPDIEAQVSSGGVMHASISIPQHESLHVNAHCTNDLPITSEGNAVNVKSKLFTGKDMLSYMRMKRVQSISNNTDQLVKKQKSRKSTYTPAVQNIAGSKSTVANGLIGQSTLKVNWSHPRAKCGQANEDQYNGNTEKASLAVAQISTEAEVILEEH